MYSTILALVLALLFLDTARAGIFVVQPFRGSTCRAGKSCTITWLDDGSRPLLSAIGWSTVGLYTGKQKLVQSIPPVDVSANLSMTFIPDAAAGPDSDQYYIALASATLKNNNGTALYTAWSPSFKLVGMSGSFDTPLPAATKPLPVPASALETTASSTPTTTFETIVVGATTTKTHKPASSTKAASRSSSASPTATPRTTSSSASSSASPVSSSPSTSPSSSASPTSSGFTTSISPSATIVPNTISTDASSATSLPQTTAAPATSGAISLSLHQSFVALTALLLVSLRVLS